MFHTKNVQENPNIKSTLTSLSLAMTVKTLKPNPAVRGRDRVVGRFWKTGANRFLSTVMVTVAVCWEIRGRSALSDTLTFSCKNIRC